MKTPTWTLSPEQPAWCVDKFLQGRTGHLEAVTTGWERKKGSVTKKTFNRATITNSTIFVLVSVSFSPTRASVTSSTTSWGTHFLVSWKLFHLASKSGEEEHRGFHQLALQAFPCWWWGCKQNLNSLLVMGVKKQICYTLWFGSLQPSNFSSWVV